MTTVLRQAVKKNDIYVDKHDELKPISQSEMRKVFDQAHNDIKSGAYNPKDIIDELYDDYDNQVASSFKFSADDTRSGDERVVAASQGVAQATIQSADATLRGISRSASLIVNAQSRSMQASTQVLQQSILFSSKTMVTQQYTTNQALYDIAASLRTLVEFNNTNTLHYYEKTVELTNRLGMMMEATNTYQSGVSNNPNTRNITKHGIDFNAIVTNIKDNLVKTIFEPVGPAEGGLMHSVLDPTTSIYAQLFTSQLMPNFKNAMGAIDNKMNGYLNKAMNAIGENKYVKGFGLSKLIGNEKAEIRDISRGSYKKDEMAWNGIAQKALIEVIPELLTSIEVNTSKVVGAEKRYFDYDNGVFKTQSQVQSEFMTNYTERMDNLLRESLEEMKNLTYHTDSETVSEQDREDIHAAIAKLIDQKITGSISDKDLSSNISGMMNDIGVNKSDYQAFIANLGLSIDNAMTTMNDHLAKTMSGNSAFRTTMNGSSDFDGFKASQASHYKTKSNIGSTLDSGAAITMIKKVFSSCLTSEQQENFYSDILFMNSLYEAYNQDPFGHDRLIERMVRRKAASDDMWNVFKNNKYGKVINDSPLGMFIPTPQYTPRGPRGATFEQNRGTVGDIDDTIFDSLFGTDTRNNTHTGNVDGILNQLRDIPEDLLTGNITPRSTNNANDDIHGILTSVINGSISLTTTTDEYISKLYELTDDIASYAADQRGEMIGLLKGVINNLQVGRDPIGYGNDDDNRGPAIGYGPALSQADPRWANHRIGTYANGAPSHMSDAGCGPTALSIIANELHSGHGINPGLVGDFASQNGYISQGGATAELFTSGAQALGLNSRVIGTKDDLLSSLMSGSPVILSGHSNTGTSDPFTSSGHIIVANGLDNDRVSVVDPLTGTDSTYDVNSLLRHAEYGWAYDSVSGQITPSHTHVGGSSSRISPKGASGLGINDDKELDKQLEIMSGLATTDFDKLLKRNETQLMISDKQIGETPDILEDLEPAETVSDSIIQSNKVTLLALSTLIAAHNDTNTRLFGKGGVVGSGEEESDLQKVNNKLFKDEDAIFKDEADQFNKDKDEVVENTKDSAVGLYDKLYTNTMIYMYGEDYENNEDYQNNSFVSSTLNLKARRQETRDRKRAAELGIMYEEYIEKKEYYENKGNDEIRPEMLDTPISNTGSTDTSNNIIPEYSNLTNRIQAIIDEVEATHFPALEAPKEMGLIVRDFNQAGEEYSEATSKALSVQSTQLSLYTEALEESSKEMIVYTEGVSDIIENATDAYVGDSKEISKVKAAHKKDNIYQSIKKGLPSVITAAGAGMMVGGMNSGFSLLGSMFLPGGPIAGAVAGAGLSILSKTEGFKTFMFGKEDEMGERKGGLISKKVSDAFKKAAPMITGGAVLGGLKSLVLGGLGGGGFFGSMILPGGPLGGAMVGAGLAMLKHSEGFKTMLFGKEDENGKRTSTFLAKAMNKASDVGSNLFGIAKNALKGAGLGALTGVTLSSMGYIPSMLAFGPVGSGIVGLGLGIASSSKKFTSFMFGEEKFDKDGNSIGKSGGVVQRVTNLLYTNVFEPIGTAFRSSVADLMGWTKKAVLFPMRLAFGPLFDGIAKMKDDVGLYIKDRFDDLTDSIMGLFKDTIKTIFTPITKVAGFIGKTAIGTANLAAKAAMTPVSIMANIGKMGSLGKRGKEYRRFYGDYYRSGIKGKLQDLWDSDEAEGNKKSALQKGAEYMEALSGRGRLADAAREGYNLQMNKVEGRNTFKWRDVGSEKRTLKEQEKARKAEEQRWKDIDKVRKSIINDDLNGREVDLNDTMLKDYQARFKKLGIDERAITTSDDIMNLLYRKGDFKTKLEMSKSGNNSEGLRIDETLEQKAAREGTSRFQNSVEGILNNINIEFQKQAARDAAFSANREMRKDMKENYARTEKRFKKKGLDIKDFDKELFKKYNMQYMSYRLLDEYKMSKFFDNDDFEGFLQYKEVPINDYYNKKIGFNNIWNDIKNGAPVKPPEGEVLSVEDAHELEANGTVFEDSFTDDSFEIVEVITTLDDTFKIELGTLGSTITDSNADFIDTIQSSTYVILDGLNNIAESIDDSDVVDVISGEYEEIHESFLSDTAKIFNANNQNDDIIDIVNAIEDSNDNSKSESIAETQSAQLEELIRINRLAVEHDEVELQLASDGHIDDSDFDDEHGASDSKIGKVKDSLAQKSKNFFQSIFDFNKKKDQEDAEDEHARSGTHRTDNEPTGYENIRDGILDAFDKFADTKLGGLILTAVTTLGKMFLGLQVLGTVATLIARNFNTDNIIDTIMSSSVVQALDPEKYTEEYVREGIDNIKLGLEEAGESLIESAKQFATDCKDTYIPGLIGGLSSAIVYAGKFVEDNIDEIIDAWMFTLEHFTVPLMTALLTQAPTIMYALAKSAGSVIGAVGGELVDWFKEKLGIGSTETKPLLTNIDDEQNQILNDAGVYTTNITVNNTLESEEAAWAEIEKKGYQNSTPTYNPETGMWEVTDRVLLDTNSIVTEDGEIVQYSNYDPLVIENGKQLGQMVTTPFKNSLSGNIVRGVSDITLSGIDNAATAMGDVLGKKIAKDVANNTKTSNTVALAKNTTDGIHHSIQMLQDIFDNLYNAALKFKVDLDTGNNAITNLIREVLDTFKLKNTDTMASTIASKLGDMISFIANLLKKTTITSEILDICVKAVGGSFDTLVKLATGAVKFITVIGMVPIMAIWGALDAAELFNIQESDVNMYHRCVSTLIEALFAVTGLDLVDMLIVIMSAINSKDYRCDIATSCIQGISEVLKNDVYEYTLECQAVFQQYADDYNKLNGTNIDGSLLESKTNDSWITDTIKYFSGFNKNEFTYDAKLLQAIRDDGYDISSMSSNDLQSLATKYTNDRVVSTNSFGEDVTDFINNGFAKIANVFGGNYATDINSTYDATVGDWLASLVGFGEGDKGDPIGYGMAAQADPRWADQAIGRFASGNIATMATGGCGPTSLAIVANKLAGKSAVTPGDMGAYASNNGYISQGGANAGLFTAGAANLGMTPHNVTSNTSLVQNLAAGRPTILSGSSTSSNDPYTKAGHIVVADGLDSAGNASVIDPATGRRKSYGINNLTKSATGGWAYGYGEGDEYEYSETPIGYSLWNPISWVIDTAKDIGSSVVDGTVAFAQGVVDATEFVGNVVGNIGSTVVDTTVSVAEGLSNAFTNTTNAIHIAATGGASGSTAVIQTSNLNPTTTSTTVSIPVSTTIADSASQLSELAKLANGSDQYEKRAEELFESQVSWTHCCNDMGMYETIAANLSGLDGGPNYPTTTYVAITWMYLNTQYFAKVGCKVNTLEKYSDIKNGAKRSSMSAGDNTYKVSSLDLALCTQYFPFQGTYAELLLMYQGQANENQMSEYLTDDIIAMIIATGVGIRNASIGSSNTKVCDIEKCAMVGSALKHLFGVLSAVTYLNRDSNISKIKSIDYTKYADVAANITATAYGTSTGLSESVALSNTISSNKITTTEQLKELADSKGLFGKIKLLSLIPSAQINSIINGTDFWTEFWALVNDSEGLHDTESTVTTLQNGTTTSASLAQYMQNPGNMQEEIVGHTVQATYDSESKTAGSYYAINLNDNGQFSVGVNQSRDANAVKLLTEIAETPILQANPQDAAILKKFAGYTNRALSSSEGAELKGVLSNPDYAAAVESVSDSHSMNLTNGYMKIMAPWYDNDDLKDPRSMIVLGDIANAGPAHLYNFTQDGVRTDFKSNWTPTSKSNELDSVTSVLTSTNCYYARQKAMGYKYADFSDPWCNRIRTTKGVAENITLKHNNPRTTYVNEFAQGFGVGDEELEYDPNVTLIGPEEYDTPDDIEGHDIGYYDNGSLGYGYDYNINNPTVKNNNNSSVSMNLINPKKIDSIPTGFGYLGKTISNRNSYEINPNNTMKYSVNKSDIVGFGPDDDSNVNEAEPESTLGTSDYITFLKYEDAPELNTDIPHSDYWNWTRDQWGNLTTSDKTLYATNNPKYEPILDMLNIEDYDYTEEELQERAAKWNTDLTTLTEGLMQYCRDVYGEELFPDNTTAGVDDVIISSDITSNDTGSSTIGSSVSANPGFDTDSVSPNENLNQVTGTDRDRFLLTALTQVGYKGKYNSTDLKSFSANANSSGTDHSKYGLEIGSNANHWCNYFTSWSAKAAGIPEDVIYRNGACINTLREARSRGHFINRGDALPQAGDIELHTAWNGGRVMVSNPASYDGSNHIEIVTGCDGNTVYAVGGNSSHQVKRNTHSVDYQGIVGYYRPPWTGKTETVKLSDTLSRTAYGASLGYGVGDTKALGFGAKWKNTEGSSPTKTVGGNIEYLRSFGYGDTDSTMLEINDSIDASLPFGFGVPDDFIDIAPGKGDPATIPGPAEPTITETWTLKGHGVGDFDKEFSQFTSSITPNLKLYKPKGFGKVSELDEIENKEVFSKKYPNAVRMSKLSAPRESSSKVYKDKQKALKLKPISDSVNQYKLSIGYGAGDSGYGTNVTLNTDSSSTDEILSAVYNVLSDIRDKTGTGGNVSNTTSDSRTTNVYNSVNNISGKKGTNTTSKQTMSTTQNKTSIINNHLMLSNRKSARTDPNIQRLSDYRRNTHTN